MLGAADDSEFHELHLDWKGSLDSLIKGDDELADSLPALQQLIALGLGAKAAETRRALLKSDLAGAVEMALGSIVDEE